MAPKPRTRTRKTPAPDLVESGTSTTGEPLPSTKSDRRRNSPESAGENPLPYSGEKKQPKTEEKPKKPESKGSGGLSMPQLPQSGIVHDGSSAILAFLLWGWVIMPFLEGGLPGMKKVLLAKFFNKKPDGSYYK